MRHRLVIWGSGGHALVVANIIRLQNHYEIVGFLDNVNVDRHGTSFCGSTILGGTEQLDALLVSGVQNLIVAFGNCEARLNLSHIASAKGYQLATAIHPKSIIADDVEVGEGTVVAAGAVINPAARIGRNVIINTCASVDHECVVEDGAHVCPGTHLAGNVTVGRAAWVGIGATVVQNVRIGGGAVVGAGAAVLHDIPDHAVAYGVPARIQPKDKKVEH